MCQSFSKKSPEPLLTPRRAGTWPTMIVSARPTMKPFSTGSEMRLATKPSRARPATRPMTPAVIASAIVSSVNLGVPCVAITADRRRRECRRGGHRPDDEMPRAAEGRVQQQRRGRRVQARDGRYAGDHGVGERLGHEHRPHGRARNRVRTQKLAPVPSQGGEEDELHRGAGIRISCSAREPAAAAGAE